jgi:hypothetical protein
MAPRARVRWLAANLAAAATVAFSVLYLLGFYAGITFRGAALLAIFLSVASFLLSLRIRSVSVAVMLTLAGLLIQIPPVQAIAEAGTVAYPGPILGVVFFVPILILGLVKAATGLRVPKTEARDSKILRRV